MQVGVCKSYDPPLRLLDNSHYIWYNGVTKVESWNYYKVFQLTTGVIISSYFNK